MKSMLIAASLTGVFVAGVLLAFNRKQLKKSGSSKALDRNKTNGYPQRPMKFTMG